MKKGIVAACLILMCALSHASNAELNATLIRVINQLNAVLPLLDEAEDEIEPNARIRLHIDSFEGSDGKKHPGFRDDLKSMRNALIDYINKPAIEPRMVKPLDFDFIGQ
jgi:RAQPRD family integrative conjugative element protein